MCACVSDLGRWRGGGPASKHVSKVSLLYHQCTEVGSLLMKLSNVNTSQQLHRYMYSRNVLHDQIPLVIDLAFCTHECANTMIE